MCKLKIPTEEKINAAIECNDGKIGISQQARRLGVDRTCICEWILRYNAQGASAFFDTRINNVYSNETKNQVIQEYVAGKGTYREILYFVINQGK